MPGLQFREGLAVEIVMVKIQPSVPANWETAFALPRQRGDELVGAGQFHVDIKFIVQPGQRLE